MYLIDGRGSKTYRRKDMQTERHTHKHTNRQVTIQTDRQPNTQTGTRFVRVMETLVILAERESVVTLDTCHIIES